jgi:hypothetical protein
MRLGEGFDMDLSSDNAWVDNIVSFPFPFQPKTNARMQEQLFAISASGKDHPVPEAGKSPDQ